MGPEALSVKAPVLEAPMPQEEVMLTPDMMFNNTPQDQAIEAVTANYEAQIGLRERISNFGHNVAEIAGRKKRAIVAAGVGIVAAFGAASPAMASETTTVNLAPETVKGVEYTTQTAKSNVLLGKSKSSAEVFAKLKIIGNHRTVSRAAVRRAKKRGQCDRISGKKAMELGIRTQGKDGSGVEYAYENRNSTMCDTDGDGKYDFRADCGNRAKGGRPNVKKAKLVVWVDNINSYKVKVRSHMAIEARAACAINNEVGSVSSSAYARVEDNTDLTVKIRNSAKAKARGKGVISAQARNYSKLQIDLRKQASAQVEASCVSEGGKIVTPETPPPTPEVPGKDGTQTPPPPTNAPGPNPAPSPEEPYPGGYQCYEEGTVKPVTPVIINGIPTCPAGSTGEAV